MGPSDTSGNCYGSNICIASPGSIHLKALQQFWEKKIIDSIGLFKSWVVFWLVVCCDNSYHYFTRVEGNMSAGKRRAEQYPKPFYIKDSILEDYIGWFTASYKPPETYMP